MDSVSIYYKNMADAMTYDGNMLFGHDYRHPSPVSIAIPAKGWWWPRYFKNRDLADKRFYAHEVHIPDDYMILTKDSFSPKNEYEEVRMIKVNERQVAIPMTWFFKLKNMTIFEQWDFLREYRLDLPFHLKSTPYLEDALGRAYDLGMESDFQNMFYDMLRDDPKEYMRRKELLNNRKKEVTKEMESRLSEINSYRIIDDSWTELVEELYCEYSSGKVFGVMNFADYCEFAFRLDNKYLPVLNESQRVHSKVWYVSMITDDYVCLNKKLQDLNKQKEFDGSQYTFEDDELLIPKEKKEIQIVKEPVKAKVQTVEREPFLQKTEKASQRVPTININKEAPSTSVHRRNHWDWLLHYLFDD